MTRTVLELRAALEQLAAEAATVDDLDHRRWTSTTASESRSPGRRRPSGKALAAIASAAAVLIALAALGVTIFGQDDSRAPAGDGSAVLEVRPLIAPAVAVDSSRPRSPDPLAALPFEIPTTSAGYDRLTAAQRQDVRAALARTDCDALTDSVAPTRLACTARASDQQLAVLLGPSLFGSDNVIRAEALAPSKRVGTLQWSVLISLDSRATTAWSKYTTAHHASSTSTTGLTECARSRVPCADFVAFLVNGDLMSIPVTAAPAGRVTQISGGFNEQSATTLAHDLAP